MATQTAIPIQRVDKPILCPPYKEPDQHWLYDRSTGASGAARPARPTTLTAHARKKEQRRQRAAARLDRVRSALTQVVKLDVRAKLSNHAV